MLRHLAFGLAALTAASASPLRAQLSRPEWMHSCSVDGFDGPAFCGTYQVWEDREAGGGRRIPMNVVVVPARSDHPHLDPLFFFTGGPGQAATDGVEGMMPFFGAIAEGRDVVFIDQRGTGLSSPLECPALDPRDGLQAFFDEFYPDEMVRRCLASQTANVALYTTPIAVDDIDEIRRALGYHRINLWGGSYGTRAAQVYMKRHPETVRAAVLHGVSPMDMENPLPFAKALERGVSETVDACLADDACTAAYPDLAGDWERSKTFFDAGGEVTASVSDPTSGRIEQVHFGRGTYADGVRHILYSVVATGDLPGMIHAAGRGDFDAFAQRELLQAIGYQNALSQGIFLTVTCAEDLRFVSEEDIHRATDGTFLGDYRVRRQLAACRIWGWGEGVSEEYQLPLRIDAPVLLFSGALDTGTSAEGAQRVADALPNSLHVVFPNRSHGFWNGQCEARIMSDFIQAGSLEGLDTACVRETRRPPFDTAVGRESGG